MSSSRLLIQSREVFGVGEDEGVEMDDSADSDNGRITPHLASGTFELLTATQRKR